MLNKTPQDLIDPPAFWLTWLAWILFFSGWTYLSIGSNLDFTYFDDGAFNYEAWRITEGALPYRDFRIIYTPGSIYSLALLFKIFSPSLLIERVYQAAVWSWLLLSIFKIVKQATRGSVAFAAWLVLLLWIGRLSHLAGGAPMSMALTFAAANILLNPNGRRPIQSLFLSGLFLGLAFLYRQDIGLYGLLACSATLIAADASGKRWFFAGSGIPVIMALVYFLPQVPMSELWFDLVTYPLSYYPGTGVLPYPWREAWLSMFIPWSGIPLAAYLFTPLVLGCAAISLLIRYGRRRALDVSHPLGKTYLLITMLGLLLMKQVSVRADAAHIVYAFVPAVILFAMIIGQGGFRLKKGAVRLFMGGLALIFIFPYLSIRLERLLIQPCFSFDLVRAKGIGVAAQTEEELGRLDDYQNTIKTVQKMTSPGEKIYVGSPRHDILCVSDPLFYFLSERPSATKHHWFLRGDANSQSVQREIVNEIERANVRVVVIRKSLDCCREPNESSLSSGSNIVDQYLLDQFQAAHNIGDNQILLKKAKTP